MNKYIEQYLAYMQSCCPELTGSELAQFSDGLTVSVWDKNAFYIKSGTIQQYNGFVIEGLIREFYTDELGNERNISFIAENSYACHYPAFMEQTPSPFSYQCLEPTITVNLPIGHIDNAYKNMPKFERYARLGMETKCKKLQQRLIDLLSQNAEQRYINFVE